MCDRLDAGKYWQIHTGTRSKYCRGEYFPQMVGSLHVAGVFGRSEAQMQTGFEGVLAEMSRDGRIGTVVVQCTLGDPEVCFVPIQQGREI